MGRPAQPSAFDSGALDMDNRRVIKFFPKAGDGAAEVGRLITIMGQDGYQLLSFSLSPASAATLVFERAADADGSPAAADGGDAAGA